MTEAAKAAMEHDDAYWTPQTCPDNGQRMNDGATNRTEEIMLAYDDGVGIDL